MLAVDGRHFRDRQKTPIRRPGAKVRLAARVAILERDLDLVLDFGFSTFVGFATWGARVELGVDGRLERLQRIVWHILDVKLEVG